MDCKQHINGALDYIEANLKSELTLRDMANAAGYSEYHFLRVFKQAARLTPADYVRKRRLSEIIRAMETDGRPISEIAFEFCFNSKENFTRAFKTEHNVLPTEYKTAGSSLKIFNRITFYSAPFKVEPEILKLESFSLTAFPSGTEKPPKFWNLYNCKKLSLRLSGGKIVKDYGALFNGGKYFIGIKTEDAAGNISGTVEIKIQAGLYAIFKTPPSSHLDFVNTIHKTWGYIGDWFPQSGYERAPGWEFESYIEASRTFSEEIFIPVKKSSSPCTPCLCEEKSFVSHRGHGGTEKRKS